jgi:hypothetical protein
MGTVIEFKKKAAAPAAGPAPVRDVLAFVIPDCFWADEDTGELVADDMTLDLLQQYFRLFGLEVSGREQAQDVAALWNGIASFRVYAGMLLDNERLFNSVASVLRQDADYVRAIARGDYAATKEHADKTRLRHRLLAAPRKSDSK